MSAEHSKRSIAFLLALSMVLTIIPVQAFSAESDTQIHIEETEPVRETEAEAESIADNTEICISDQTEAVEEVSSEDMIPAEQIAGESSEQITEAGSPWDDTGFSHAQLSADYTCLTEHADVQIRAAGVTVYGTEVSIPEGILDWSVSDEAVGSVNADGVFMANALGETDVTLSLDGREIGSITMYVVQPDTLYFTESNIDACYGEIVPLSLEAIYNRKNVAIVPEDVNFTVSQNDEGVIGGTVSGFTFIGNEDSKLGTVIITAFLEANPQVSTALSVHLIVEADEPEISPVPPGTGSYIGFTADMHDQTGKLQDWLIGVQDEVEPDLEYMVFGGDFSYNRSITSFNNAVSIVNQLVGQNRGVYTTGNHEYENNSVLQQMANTAGFVRIGLAVDAVNYDIYCVGAAGMGSGTLMTFDKNDRDTLEAYLKNAPRNEPIFIVAHWPLHYFESRTTTGAAEMIDLLNQYPNVVFLWGHNHSQDDPHYGEILTDGDFINYKNGYYKEIKFTYASAGAMRGDRPPYYGLAAHVSDSGDRVTLTYYGAKGTMTNVSETVKTGDGTGIPDKPGNVIVAGVALNKTSTTLAVGEQEILSAAVAPSNATNKAVTWSSDNPSVAAVVNGVVTAKTVGIATITATTKDGGKTAVCTVTVKPAAVAVTGVSLNKTSIILAVGEEKTLTAAVMPSNAANQNVTWKSSNDNVVTVSNGIVAAKSAGIASITVTTEDGCKTATCNVTVNPNSVAVTRITVSEERISLHVGGYKCLTAAVLPANASNKSVIWNSDTPAVATVENGIVKAVSDGQAVITVRTEDGNICAYCNVSVSKMDEHHVHRAVFVEKTAATCLETGMEEHWFCSGCDSCFEDRDCTRRLKPEDLTIHLTDHSGEAISGKPARCTDDGLTDGIACSLCGTILASQEVIDALGHIEVIDEVLAPGCSETGLTEGRHCSVCGTILAAQEEIPAHGHELRSEDGGFVCGSCGLKMYLHLQQEHISLYRNQRHQIQADVVPDGLAKDIRWTVEEGGDEVLSVDNRGNLRALGVGTAYIAVSVTYGDITMTDRCRVDVSEAIALDGIQLSAQKLTSELNSTDYSTFDVLLQLPQNYPEGKDKLAALQDRAVPVVDNGIAIERARFADETMANLFGLVVLDDRRIQVVPTDYAVANPGEVKSKYTSAVIVTVQGKEYTSEALTLTVKKSSPKLKATIAAFNSFYSGTSQEIIITGGTPTQITARSLPEWLTLKENTLELKPNAPLKNLSIKAELLVKTEEWRVPAIVTLSVKNSYKAPNLKLAASSVTMTAQTANSSGVELTLKPKSRKDTLKSLNVTGITAPNGYSVTNFSQEDGTFTLKAAGALKPGKITLNVTFSDTKVKVPQTLTVQTAAVTLKPSVKSLTMNTALRDTASIVVNATPADYRVTDPDFRLTDAKGVDKTGELDVRYEEDTILISTTDATPTGADYKLHISAGGSKEAVIAIKTVSGNPSVNFKAKDALDLGFPDKFAVIHPVFKNYNGAFTISRMTVENSQKTDVTKQFQAEVDGRAILVRCAENTAAGSYTMKLKLTLVDGSTCENTVKISVKRTAIKLKLSTNKLSLNKWVNEAATVGVSCTTKGYDFSTPLWELSAPGKLDISYANGRLRVATNSATRYGATYRILVRANAAAPAATLTVTIPAQNKSAVTASLKASGSLDVIREGKGVTVTPGYKNVTADTEKLESLVFYSSADNYTKPVNGKFQYDANGKGGYVVSRAPGAKLDNNMKYKAELVSLIGTTEVRSPKVSIKVTMGSAKLTVKEGSVDLFAKDKNDRAIFHLTAKDGSLNTAERVEIKDAKYKDLFQIYTHGNGEFAIGFKNGKVSSKLAGKTTAVTLNVWVEGNHTVKSNTTVKLKLNIVK